MYPGPPHIELVTKHFRSPHFRNSDHKIQKFPNSQTIRMRTLYNVHSNHCSQKWPKSLEKIKKCIAST